MAFPTVQTTNESSTNTAGTSHTVNLPTGITAGDLLIVCLDKGSTAATVNALAGWTELLDENSGNGLYIAYRLADGTEGSTITLTTSASTRSAEVTFRISGAENPATQAPQIGTTSSGTGSTPDPPAVTPTGGAKDYLWITFCGSAGEQADDGTYCTAFPTGFADNQLQKTCGTAGTNLGGLIAAATRQQNASSQDPGTFTVSETGGWRAQTIAIHPVGPQDFTRTVDDTEGLSDTGMARNVNPTGTEALDLTDSVIAQLFTEHSRTPADPLGLTDSPAAVSVFGRTQTDPLGLTDTTSPVSAFTRTSTEPLGLTDAITLVVSFARSQTDPLGLTDSTTVDLTAGGTSFTRTIDDTLGLADADQSQQFDVAETITEALGLTDSVDVQASGAPTRQVDDTLGLTDTAAQATVYIRTVDDPFGLTDTATPQLAGAGTRQVDDTLGLTDAVTQATPYIRSQTDNLGLTDAVTPQLTRAVFDNLGLTDTRAEDVGKNPDDALGLTDSISVVLSWVRTVDDLLALTDPANQQTTYIRTADDSAGMSDAASAQTLSTTDQQVTDGLGLTDTVRARLTVIRPNTGTVTRPATGTITRPFTGTVLRP